MLSLRRAPSARAPQNRTVRHALLQVVNGHVLEVDLLGAIDVEGIGENADGHARAGDVGEPACLSVPLRSATSVKLT